MEAGVCPRASAEMLVGDLMRRLGFALRCSEKSLVQAIKIFLRGCRNQRLRGDFAALALAFRSGDTACGGWRSIQALADFHRPLAESRRKLSLPRRCPGTDAPGSIASTWRLNTHSTAPNGLPSGKVSVTAEHLAKTIGNRPCNLPTQRKFFVISQSARTRLE